MAAEFDSRARARIERFLADYPAGHLHVVTGFASMAGLAWLARQTERRPVTVVIGDLRTGLDNFEGRDAAGAAAFVKRSDVRVLNWYRTAKNKRGAAVAHSKVFVVEGPEQKPIAALAGSANLTMAGLDSNVETMVEAIHIDRDATFKQVMWLERQAWDATDKILEKVKEKEPVGAGCLQSMAAAAFAYLRFALLERHPHKAT